MNFFLFQHFKFICEVLAKQYFQALKAVLLNPDRPGRSTRDPGAGPVRVCQKTGQCNDPVKPGRPGGSTRDLGETRPRPGVFFFKCGI
jgi:hypothetical protein